MRVSVAHAVAAGWGRPAQDKKKKKKSSSRLNPDHEDHYIGGGHVRPATFLW